MSETASPSSNPKSPTPQQESVPSSSLPSDLPTPSQSLSRSPSSQPSQPLTDFMGVLKMRRLSEDSDGGKGVKDGGVNGAKAKKHGGRRSVRERSGSEEVEDMETEVGPEKETLVDKFKKDPNSVLELLESVLTMDKVASLLSKNHRQDKRRVEGLRSKLEVAYHTLKECSQQKITLTEKIEVTNEKIKAKRKELERLRGELKILGEEELQLKRKRDASYTNCADVKKKLKCSQDALEQLAVLAPAKNNGSNATKGGAVGEGQSLHT